MTQERVTYVGAFIQKNDLLNLQGTCKSGVDYRDHKWLVNSAMLYTHM